jgi:hypothetical protein
MRLLDLMMCYHEPPLKISWFSSADGSSQLLDFDVQIHDGLHSLPRDTMVYPCSTKLGLIMSFEDLRLSLPPRGLGDEQHYDVMKPSTFIAGRSMERQSNQQLRELFGPNSNTKPRSESLHRVDLELIVYSTWYCMAIIGRILCLTYGRQGAGGASATSATLIKSTARHTKKLASPGRFSGGRICCNDEFFKDAQWLSE